jgi:hypothetical protein
MPTVRLPSPRSLLTASTSVRCDAAIFPKWDVDRTRRGHRENGAHDPKPKSMLREILHKRAMRSRTMPVNQSTRTALSVAGGLAP